MKIENVKIYDLEESLIASGYPMRTKIELHSVNEKDINRCKKLVEATKTGNMAHNQFMTGIRVAFDVSGSNKWFIEAERYRFLEFVSSQSTMHRITKFDLDKCYNEYVDSRVIEIMKEKINEYNWFIAIKNFIETLDEETRKQYKFINGIDKKDLEEKIKRLYLEILYSNPAGFTLTARMTTNYRCLRNIYIQRHDHKLPEWRALCRWIETLPYAEEFLIN